MHKLHMPQKTAFADIAKTTETKLGDCDLVWQTLLRNTRQTGMPTECQHYDLQTWYRDAQVAQALSLGIIGKLADKTEAESPTINN